MLSPEFCDLKVKVLVQLNKAVGENSPIRSNQRF